MTCAVPLPLQSTKARRPPPHSRMHSATSRVIAMFRARSVGCVGSRASQVASRSERTLLAPRGPNWRAPLPQTKHSRVDECTVNGWSRNQRKAVRISLLRSGTHVVASVRSALVRPAVLRALGVRLQSLHAVHGSVGGRLCRGKWCGIKGVHSAPHSASQSTVKALAEPYRTPDMHCRAQNVLCGVE